MAIAKGVSIPKKIDGKGFGVVPTESLQKSITEVNSYRNNIIEKFNSTRTALEGVFFAPMTDLFSNFLQTGKFAFKEFAQSILKAISQIVGKIIATGVVTLLASLFIPGFSAAGGGIGKTLLSGITGALGFGGGGFGGAGGARVGQPNFGGVSGGGMQMAGAVNLTLRGSDLVGSINRTNATINRVG